MKYILALLLVLGNKFCSAQWNLNTSVNLEIAALETADLQTAVTSDGKTWIAFYHHNGSNYDMRAQLLDQSGNKLLGNDGALVCNQTSGSATFVFNVCLDASNNLIIGFQYEVAGTPTAVITKINTDGSLPWGSGGIQLGAGLAPYPALLTTDETVVAWNNSSPATLYLQKISSGGTAVWASPIPVTVSSGNTTRGQIVANPGGSFTMVLQKRGVGISTTLYAQRYDNDGIAQWALPVQLSTLTTSGARYYSIAVSADTTFFGYYAASGSRFFSYVQRINPDGSIPWGMNGSVFSTYSTGSDPYQQTTNIGFFPGASVIWAACTYSNTSQSQYGVFVQKFDKTSGAVLLDPLGKEVYPVSSNLDTQTGALGFYNDETPMFISYDVNYKIKLTPLVSSGDPVPWLGFPYEMSSTTASLATPKGRFAFNYNQFSGNAVAIWYENRGTEYRAYAQSRNLFIIPITLVDFKAVKNKNQVSLSWNTVSEIDNKGFYIERSADAVNFKTIGFENTKAAGGNSSLNIDYTFTDIEPFQSYNYYRLKQVDINGKYTYSKVLLVRFDKEFYINNIFPSPATTTLHIQVESPVNSNGNLIISDAGGKIITRRSIVINKGISSFDVDVKGMAKGMYVLKINNDRNDIAVAKWLKE